jgi:hypothetical protein
VRTNSAIETTFQGDNDTILDISLDANPIVEKSKEIAECPYIARAY